MNSDNEIVVSPEVQKLKDDCGHPRDELAALLSERHHLVNTDALNILAAYTTTIGVKKYEALSMDVEVRQPNGYPSKPVYSNSQVSK